MGGTPGDGSNPINLTVAGDELRFLAFDGARTSIWISDGTAGGTRPIDTPEITSGRAHNLLSVGNLTFFTSDEIGQEQLWRTDGTAEGTLALTPPTLRVQAFAAFGEELLFTAAQPGESTSFWTSDGTPGGTGPLIAVPEGYAEIFELAVVGSQFFFEAGNPESGALELWRSDGTALGTRAIGELFSFPPPSDFVELGGLVYFGAALDSSGVKLWRTNGTRAGTTKVFPDTFAAGSGAENLFVHQNRIFYFASDDEILGRRALWKTDGTMAGTVKLGVLRIFAFHDGGSPHFTPVAGMLFFVAGDEEGGLDLWKTDGSPQGTSKVMDLAPTPEASRFGGLMAARGRLFFSAFDTEHGLELWETDGTESGTRMIQDIAPGEVSSSPRELTVAGDRLFFSANDGVFGTELWALPLDPALPPCAPAAGHLCLGAGRFKVEAFWRDFQGRAGRGHAVALTPDTGYFWFFSSANVEAIVKVLDGRGVNGHRWVFYGALSNVEYSLTVTDTVTGAARRYINPPSRFASVGDTTAFGPQGASGSELSLGPSGESYAPLVEESVGVAAPAGACAPTSARLCLNGGRFAVEAKWRDFQGRTGMGTAVPLTGDTGYFWFFKASNVEVVLKVLDGRPVNGKFWVFYGALSNVEYTLTVTDTATGKRREYKNPRGRFGSVGDTGAF